MKFSITVKDRLGLRQGSLYAPWSDVRVRCAVLLHVAAGRPLAQISRSCGLSRPTVYKLAVVYLATRRVEDLRPEGIGRRFRASLLKLAGDAREDGRAEESAAHIERARLWRRGG